MSSGLFLVGIPLLILTGLGIGVTAFFVSLSRQKRSSIPHAAELDHRGRALLKPIRELNESLATLANANQVPELNELFAEAAGESAHVLTQSAAMIEARAALLRSVAGSEVAASQLGKLEIDLGTTVDPAAQAALQAAIDARQAELRQYGATRSKIAAIEARLLQAEATLAELRAKLVTGSAGIHAERLETDELTGLVARLKSLGSTFDEAEDMLDSTVVQ